MCEREWVCVSERVGTCVMVCECVCVCGWTGPVNVLHHVSVLPGDAHLTTPTFDHTHAPTHALFRPPPTAHPHRNWARAHTCTHTHTHAPSLSHTHAHTHPLSHTHTSTLSHTRTHTLSHAHAHTHTHPHSRTHARTHRHSECVCIMRKSESE